MKTYKLEAYGNEYEIALIKHTYTSNGALGVEMFTVENGKLAEPWSMLTVNLNGSKDLGKDEAFIDTNNNGPRILAWLEENGIAERTGKLDFSGYCMYPGVKFLNLDEMEVAE